jgi:hypothetical protein
MALLSSEPLFLGDCTNGPLLLDPCHADLKICRPVSAWHSQPIAIEAVTGIVRDCEATIHAVC